MTIMKLDMDWNRVHNLYPNPARKIIPIQGYETCGHFPLFNEFWNSGFGELILHIDVGELWQQFHLILTSEFHVTFILYLKCRNSKLRIPNM